MSSQCNIVISIPYIILEDLWEVSEKEYTLNVMHVLSFHNIGVLQLVLKTPPCQACNCKYSSWSTILIDENLYIKITSPLSNPT